MALAISADEQPDDKPTVVIRASDIQKTGSQVAVLCQIFEATAGVVSSFLESGVSRDLEPAARETALKTFEMVNQRLRDVMDDDRWHLRNTPAEEQSFKLLDEQLLKVKEQTVLLQGMQKPHQRMGPNIRFFPEAGWVAWMGAGLPTTNCLHGRGASPAQAYAAFDRNYNQIMPIAMAQSQSEEPSDVQPIPETPTAPRKSPKKK